MAETYPRERLFCLLDKGRNKPLTWIAAPAGSGKTTLAAGYVDSRGLPCLWYQLDEGDGDLAGFFHYLGLAAKKAAPRHRKQLPHLTPEYLQCIPVFTRRYFENLFNRLTPPFTVVFDDYQEVPDSSGFHEMMAHALDTIPEGIRVIVLSRTTPPPQLARLQANSRLTLLGWDELRFTRDETGYLLDTHGHGKPANDVLNLLHRKTEGWAAGLVLLMARDSTATLETNNLDHQTRHSVFDYFANEIFDRLDPVIQEFLLKTSLLHTVEPGMAEKLTGIRVAGQVLEKLNRNHFFTQKHGLGYLYHPLFREFLLARAMHRFSPDDVSRTRKEAAALLVESGQIEEAADLFIESEEWNGLENLIICHASALIAHGMCKTLEGWLNKYPRTRLGDSPWLLYWLAICLMQLDPTRSRQLAEQAFALFQTKNDDAGACIAWATAINSFLHEWDNFGKIGPLIAWLDERITANPVFSTPEIETLVTVSMAGAQVLRRKDHASLKQWNERALTLTRQTADLNLRLQAGINAAQFYILSGDFANGRIVTEELAKGARSSGAAPLMKVICASMESFVEIVTTGSEESLRMVSAGIEMANESGIHVWDHMLFAEGVYGSLNTGDLVSAADYLEQMKASLSDVRSFGQFHFHLLSGWYSLLRNELGVALAHAENALKFISGNVAFCPEAMFTSHYEIAQIVHEQGNHERASRHMALAGDCVRHAESPFLEYMHLMAAAQFAFDRNEDKAGYIHLHKAMELGRRHGYISMFWWWRPAVIARLCQRALSAGIEVEYVENLIRKRKLFPEVPPLGEDDWPWLVKVCTLGRFEVYNDGKPVDFSGKRKLAELFKTLISSGGTALREEQMTDLLWPEADGDAAHNVFKMTMSRLRRLLPGDAIRLEDGTYSFNRKMVWADLWAFEQMYEAAVNLWQKVRKPGLKSAAAKDIGNKAIALTEKILALYQGHFLSGDTSHAWTVSQRERLRTRLLRLTVIAGQHLEEQGKWRSAAEFYRRGLDADNLQEEFYQRLITCHNQLGQRTEALAVYERCRAELATLLKINPSPKTEALYAELRR